MKKKKPSVNRRELQRLKLQKTLCIRKQTLGRHKVNAFNTTLLPTSPVLLPHLLTQPIRSQNLWRHVPLPRQTVPLCAALLQQQVGEVRGTYSCHQESSEECDGRRNHPGSQTATVISSYTAKCWSLSITRELCHDGKVFLIFKQNQFSSSDQVERGAVLLRTCNAQWSPYH